MSASEPRANPAFPLLATSNRRRVSLQPWMTVPVPTTLFSRYSQRVLVPAATQRLLGNHTVPAILPADSNNLTAVIPLDKTVGTLHIDSVRIDLHQQFR